MCVICQELYVRYALCTKIHRYMCVILCIILSCICALYLLYYNQVKKPSTKRKEAKQMKTYKIYVDGNYVGTDTLTVDEVKRINNDTSITLSKLD